MLSGWSFNTDEVCGEQDENNSDIADGDNDRVMINFLKLATRTKQITMSKKETTNHVYG